MSVQKIKKLNDVGDVGSVVDGGDEGEPLEPTEIEKAIDRYVRNFSKAKHVDTKTFALDYMFPLLKKLAAESGDHTMNIEGLIEAVDSLEDGGADGDVVDILKNTVDFMVRMAQVLDATMVASGFYVSDGSGGLKATDKIPAEVRAAYEKVSREAPGVISTIHETVASYEDDDDDDDDDDGDDDGDDEGGDGEGEVRSNRDSGAVVATAAFVEGIRSRGGENQPSNDGTSGVGSGIEGGGVVVVEGQTEEGGSNA